MAIFANNRGSGAQSYVVNHPEFGWLAFGGNVKEDGEEIEVQPRDAFRQRVYIGPLGIWLTLDSGIFESVEINPQTRAVRVGLTRGNTAVNRALLRVQQPAKLPGIRTYRPAEQLPTERDAVVVPLQRSTIWIELEPR